MKVFYMWEPLKNFSARIQLDYNFYWSLLLRFLLAMLLFSLTRVAFLLVNSEYFDDIGIYRLLRIMQGGLTFDLTSVLYINCLFIFLNVIPFKIRHNPVYQRSLMYWYFFSNGLALAINVGDIIYFQFTTKRTTASVFEAFAGESQMGGLFFQFLLDYWYVTLFWIVLIYLMIWLYRLVNNHTIQVLHSPVYFITNTCIMLLIAYLTVAGIRGGFTKSTRPINLNNAGKYVAKPIEMAAVLNTPFCLIRTIDKKPPQKYDFFADESELNKVYRPVYFPAEGRQQKHDNVMIIILESFSREFIGSLNPDVGEGFTPFLDSLIANSLVFSNAYANGMKSIDGLPAVVGSIPALVHPFVLSHGSTNRINSIASLLKTMGYNSTYYYGGPNGSMGYDAFVNLAGFDHYMGKDEYGNNKDYDGVWGIWDEEFFQFTAESMRNVEEPFCNVLMSVSSHHPFKVPEKHQQRFDSEDPYGRVIPYTDYALKRFFEKISAMDWFDNTLFVITADHSSGHYAQQFKTSVGLFAVPIILYKPDGSLKGNSDMVAQQIDILPTVLNYLNYDQPYVAFGNDLFNDSTDHYVINFVSGSYQIVSNEYALQFDDDRTFGLYRYKEDPLMEQNLMNDSTWIKESLELNLKARIQQYNNRLADNKMTYKGELQIPKSAQEQTQKSIEF